MMLHLLYIKLDQVNTYNAKMAHPVNVKWNPAFLSPLPPLHIGGASLYLLPLVLGSRLSASTHSHHLVCRSDKRPREIKSLGIQMFLQVGEVTRAARKPCSALQAAFPSGDRKCRQEGRGGKDPQDGGEQRESLILDGWAGGAAGLTAEGWNGSQINGRK